MVFLFTGLNGTGKTHDAVEYAFQDWLEGRDIYSNTMLFFENFGGTQDQSIIEQPKNFSFIERVKWQLKRDKQEENAPRRGRIIFFDNITDIITARNATIIFDEGGVLFSARGWGKLPEEIQYKLQQQRKHGLDLFCTVPNIAQIDIEYRRLIQVWFHYSFYYNLFFYKAFKKEEKQIEDCPEAKNAKAVPTIKLKVKYIFRNSRELYDTNFDVGFQRFKVSWLTNQTKMGINQKWMIHNKKLSMNEAYKVYLSTKRISSPAKLTA